MKSVHGQFKQNLSYARPSVSLLLFSTVCFQSPITHTSPIPFHRSSGASVSISVQVLSQRNMKDAREKLFHSKDNILAGGEAPLVTLELRRWKQSQQETQLNPLCSGRMEEGRDARMQKSRELCFSRAHAVAQMRAEHPKWQIQLEGWRDFGKEDPSATWRNSLKTDGATGSLASLEELLFNSNSHLHPEPPSAVVLNNLNAVTL